MDITPQIAPGLKIIQSYQAGCFRINGEKFSGPVMVMDDKVLPWVPSAQGGIINDDDIRALKGQVDVLLIGMGGQFSMLPPSQRARFIGIGFQVDIMDTPAACRTYNILTMEGRRVAAALHPV